MPRSSSQTSLAVSQAKGALDALWYGQCSTAKAWLQRAARAAGKAKSSTARLAVKTAGKAFKAACGLKARGLSGCGRGLGGLGGCGRRR